MDEYNLGSLIRVNRICQNISCRSLAEMCKMQASQLSKIERGLEKGTDKVIQNILSELDLDIDYVFENSKLLQSEFRDVYLSIAYCKNDAEEQLAVFNRKYFSKFESIEVILANYIIFSMKKINKIKFLNMHHILNECLNNMTIWQKQLYYEYYGYYLYCQNNYEEAKKYYQLALNLCVDELNRSMVYYHMALLYEKQNDLVEAFRYNQNATELFNKAKNIRRTVHTASQLGTLNCRVGKFQLGFEILIQCIETMELIGYKDQLDNIYRKLIWYNIVSHDYAKASYYLNISYSYNQENIYYYFYATWVCYQLGNYEKAMRCASIAKTLNGPTYIKKLVEVTRNMIENKDSIIILEKLEALYSKVATTTAYTIQEFVLDLINSEYLKYKNYEKLYYYTNQLVLLYRNKNLL